MLIRGQEIDYHLIESNKELAGLLDTVSGLDIVAVDTESYPDLTFGSMASGLDPHTSFMRMIQFNWITNKEPYILDLKKLVISDSNWEGLKAFFIGNVRKVAHNATFEINILRKTFGICSNGFECTKVDMQLIGGATGSKSSKLRGYSYASLCRDYLDVHVDKTEQTSDWGREELSSQQMEYAALDVGAPKDSSYCSLLLEAHKLMYEVLITPSPAEDKDSNGYNMEFIRNVDQQAMAVVAGMQYVGNPVNKAVFDSIYSSLNIRVNTLRLELCRELGFAVNPRMTLVDGKPTRVYEVNETTSKLLNNAKGLVKHVKSVLGSKGVVLDDLRAESLEKIIYNLENESDDPHYQQEEEDEFLVDEEQKLRDIKLVNTLLDYKGVVKMLGSDYRKVINPFTGCMHAQYQTIGASTGRMSSGGKLKTLEGEMSLNLKLWVLA